MPGFPRFFWFAATASVVACVGTSEPITDGSGGAGAGVVGPGGSGPGASGGAASSGGATGSGGRGTGGTITGSGGGGAGTGGSVGSGGRGSGGTAPGTGGAVVAGTGGSTGAGGAGGGSSGCGKTSPTGIFQSTIMVGGVARGYYVSIPTGYDPNVPRALVFGYHGSTYTGRMMRPYLDMEKAPLLAKGIFVYPDGMPPPDDLGRAWELTATGKDMPFFDAMVAQMTADYCVDAKRILVSGQSYGGLMTNALGCLRGSVIRAIAPIAGSGPNNTAQCQGPVAAWINHGTDDDAVSFTSGQRGRDFWLTKNGCTTTTVQGTPMQCQNYQGCMPGYPVIWCQHTGETGHQQTAWGKVAVREFFAGF